MLRLWEKHYFASLTPDKALPLHYQWPNIYHNLHDDL